MIFQNIAEADDRLQSVIDEIESSEIGLRAVSASVYRVPYVRIKVDFTVQKARQFNILEEFILRAAAEFNPPPTKTEISSVLGLDPIFVASTCQDLLKLSVIKQNAGDLVELTAAGRDFYSKKSIPEPSQDRSITLSYDCITKALTYQSQEASSSGNEPLVTDFVKVNMTQEEQSTAALDAMSLASLILATQQAKLGIHRPSEGQQITGITNMSLEAVKHHLCVFVLVYDTLKIADEEDNVSIRAYNLAPTRRNLTLEEIVGSYLQGTQTKIADLLPMEEAYIDSLANNQSELPPYIAIAKRDHLSKQQAARNQPAENAIEPPSAGLTSKRSERTEVLRNQDIRPRFLKTLESVVHSLLILSPWINDHVVDAAFRQRLSDIAQRGALILIGWGIGRAEENEDRAPSQALLAALQDIKNLKGIPAVNVWWLGNHHEKEVIADDRVLLAGSHNWLSYRGDRYLRGESVFCFIQSDLIKEAKGYWFPKFSEAARLRWSDLLNSPSVDIDGLVRCCVTWIAVNKPALAYGQLYEAVNASLLPINKCIEILDAINGVLPLCSPQAYVSQDVPSLVENYFVRFVGLSRSSLDPKQATQKVAASFRSLLRRNADFDKNRVVQFANNHVDVLIDAGWLAEGRTIDEAIDKLIKPSVKPTHKKGKNKKANSA